VLADLGFLGGGKMASAIFDGLRSNNKELQCSVFEPNEDALKTWTDKGANRFENDQDLFLNSKWVVWAVKPQIFKKLKDHYSKLDFKGEGMISVMAGISSAEIEEVFPNAAVIRTMPNTPLMLKQGMVGMAKGSQVTDEQMNFVASLFSPVAETLKVDEKQIDGVTAISGSGPAYLFYLTEHLIEKSKSLDLNSKEITALFAQTLRGAADMLDKSGMSAKELREQVTSPGGTTQAALESMASYNLGQNFAESIMAAHQRSLELSK